MERHLFSFEPPELDEPLELPEQELWDRIEFLEMKLQFAERENVSLRTRLNRYEAVIGIGEAA